MEVNQTISVAWMPLDSGKVLSVDMKYALIELEKKNLCKTLNCTERDKVTCSVKSVVSVHLPIKVSDDEKRDNELNNAFVREQLKEFDVVCIEGNNVPFELISLPALLEKRVYIAMTSAQSKFVRLYELKGGNCEEHSGCKCKRQ